MEIAKVKVTHHEALRRQIRLQMTARSWIWHKGNRSWPEQIWPEQEQQAAVREDSCVAREQRPTLQEHDRAARD